MPLLEEWRDVANYEGLYAISNHGRIMNRYGKFLTPSLINSGYLVFYLYPRKEGSVWLAHRLVAFAFCGKPDGKDFVNHKDSNRLNNHADNLEWVTQSENMQHCKAAGRLRPNRYPVIGCSVKDGSVIEFACQRDAEIALSSTGKQSSALNHFFQGKKKSAYGYIWAHA